MSQQEKIKFIVKNGRYAGSIIELEPDQEYSLGRSFHCDIAIDDSRFAERQMLLNIGQDGVQIKLLAEGKLKVNGESKDTNAQSEWRNMDPRSNFIMNDLEFSFEVPATLLSQFQERAKVPELAVIADGEQKTRSQNTASRSTSESSHRDFGELETQVPSGDDQDDYKENDEIQVVPNLADELEFEKNSGPKYTRKAPESEPSKNEINRHFVLWGSVFVGLLLFSGVYYFIGLQDDESEYNEMANQAESSFDEELAAGQMDSLDSLGLTEESLSPFVMQEDVEDVQYSDSFTDPQDDDPFLAYDQSKALSAVEPLGLGAGSADPNIAADMQGSTEAGKPEQKKAEPRNLAKNSAGQNIESDQKNDSVQSNENLQNTESVAVNESSQGQDQVVESAALSFGQLNPKSKKMNTQEVETDASQNEPSSVQSSESAGEPGATGVWAVIHGKAKPETIVVQATKDLLSGLALGQLSVTTRAPREINGKLEKEPVVVVSGYVQDRRTWMRAEDIINQDLQGIGTLIDNVSSPAVRKAQLERWIAESDIKGKVQTYLSERGLVAKVNLNPSQITTWQAIAKKYVDKFDNSPELFVMRDPGDWLQIRSISFGSKPYLVTTDGAVLMPGAKLSNGYSIVAIRRSGVELKDQFGSYTYVF